MPELTDMSFEDALKELETIVSNLEVGNIPLEKSIASYERGVALQKHCTKKLQEAKMRVEKITVDADDTVSTTPF